VVDIAEQAQVVDAHEALHPIETEIERIEQIETTAATVVAMNAWMTEKKALASVVAVAAPAPASAVS
jgi:hypothetical protein